MKLVLSHTIDIDERKPYLCHFMGNICYIGMLSDVYKSVLFKLGMMIDSIKLYSLMPV